MPFQEVIDFWFSPRVKAKHWDKDPDFDAEIRTRFAELHHQAQADKLSHWRQAADGRLAEIIVLDQFSRNMFRDSAEMYAADAKALNAAVAALDAGFDVELPFHHRVFLYMPLMHAESVALQQRCVHLFEQLVQQAQEDALRNKAETHLRYAIAHRDIVQRFGRFPHRNAILGRQSTAEELEFLKQPGSRF
ncbi:MAG: DUF924 domain-containing protein [Deltaproteobacteria bacterium]|nr:DUF924 domain-containing protein [Deltaproteobacteria bacterium]